MLKAPKVKVKIKVNWQSVTEVLQFETLTLNSLATF